MKLIALVDGSEYSHSVCDYAAWASLRLNAKLETLHVLDDRNNSAKLSNLSGNIGLGARTALMEELAEIDAQRSKLAQLMGRAILDDAVERIGEAGFADVETRLRHGDLVETVLSTEGDADCLILGKRGEAADFAKMHLGSNLERIVRASRKPILIASRKFKVPQSFMIAYDGGPSAEKAVESVCSSPLYTGLDCHLLCVTSPDNEALITKVKVAAEKLEILGGKVTTEITKGQPASIISERVTEKEIDLLVMGTYGHSKIRSLIIGSTTTELIRKCLIPVILYR
ncbi:universal stress protein [Hirschia litorea]|uniref:Universal stress protein n=1 Tax=Hirschia litorea TaxID=1199156 RepID=A0ABW2IH70_9PROT